MAMGIDSGHASAKDKIKNNIESQRMVKALISRYKFVQANRDNIIAEFDAEIAELSERRRTTLQDFNTAPKQLIALAAQLKELQTKYSNLKNATGDKAQRIKRYKALQEKLAMLENELEAEGIDVNQQPEDPTENL